MHEDSTIRWVLTARDSGERMAEKPPLSFGPLAWASRNVIEVNEQESFQVIEGFGGAFTEAAAYALSKMKPEQREEVLRAYFDPRDGLRYSLCRTHINSCDFSLGNYSYDEVGGDYNLSHFDISHDRSLLIPLIKDAMKMAERPLRLFASPWSPPAWMKTNGEMNNGGSLKKDCLETWALYFAKYIKAYAAEGIPIWGVTVQNEPEATQRWDSCRYNEEEERDFVKYYLGPRLQAEGLAHVKIIVWDHNKCLVDRRAAAILSDPVAANYIWGVGFHWYSGDYVENLETVHRRFPDKKLLFTEGCHEGGVKLGSWEMGERYGHAMIGDLSHWTVGWVDWNMVLDQRGGPNHVGNFCDAPVIADHANQTIHYQSAYYYIGHFSRFIQPGAYRLGIRRSNRLLDAVAFRNPDQSIVVVVMNGEDEEIPFHLKDGDLAAKTTIPAHAIATFLFD